MACISPAQIHRTTVGITSSLIEGGFFSKRRPPLVYNSPIVAFPHSTTPYNAGTPAQSRPRARGFVEPRLALYTPLTRLVGLRFREAHIRANLPAPDTTRAFYRHSLMKASRLRIAQSNPSSNSRGSIPTQPSSGALIVLAAPRWPRASARFRVTCLFVRAAM